MSNARKLLEQLQDEMYEVIKNKPRIRKKEIEEKMGLETFPHSEGGADWSDEFYAIMYQLERQGRIYRASRGRFIAK